MIVAVGIDGLDPSGSYPGHDLLATGMSRTGRMRYRFLGMVADRGDGSGPFAPGPSGCGWPRQTTIMRIWYA